MTRSARSGGDMLVLVSADSLTQVRSWMVPRLSRMSAYTRGCQRLQASTNPFFVFVFLMAVKWKGEGTCRTF